MQLFVKVSEDQKCPRIAEMLRRIVVLAAVVALCLAGPSPVTRPCHLHNLYCIGVNLAANSHCNPQVRGSIPGEYTIPEFRFDTPYFNASYIDENLVIRNHDKCVVSDFFFNVGADSALLGIDCPGLEFESNRTLIQHNTLREDTIYSYLIAASYPLIRLTINLSHADKLNVCAANVFTDVTALPSFKITPNNKPTENFLSRDLTLLNIYERETFFYRGQQLARFFINSVICDFGCNA